ncbi:hypothetical protein GRR11_23795 [Escherichia coli]|nr:hypothetical protein [Escherichia coli]EFI5655376.1 hypothetical protein [Escherichia coli]EFI5671410.1 hypothetical protein [Escherichia coli]
MISTLQRIHYWVDENSFTMNGGGYVGGFFIGVHMPPRTPKTCRVRGYRNTTTDPSGYCKSHKSEGWKQYKPGQSCHQRGYGSRGCPSCSPVLCGGGRNRTLTQILVGTMLCLSGLSRCHSCKALYQTFVRAVRLTGPPGGVACHGAGASRKKASF